MPSDNMSERPERVDDANWQEREYNRFVSGHYKPVPWMNEAFWQTFYGRGLTQHHLAHISVTEPAMIAFTESDAKGRQDRQTRMKPGRYLHRFFSEVLSVKQIAFYAEWWVKGAAPEVDGETEAVTLHMATTQEEIIGAYAGGPYSCMRGEDAVRVYAAGDLAVAWTKDTRPGWEGQAQSRAICWPEQKIYGRIYPTATNERYCGDGYASVEESQAVRNRLEKMLRDKGWTSIFEKSDAFDGARLLKIRDGGRWVMPYLDGGGDAGAGSYGVSDAGPHWEMCKYSPDYQCDNTNGYIGDSPDEDDDDYDDDRVCCERCDDRGDSDDMCSVITEVREDGRTRFTEQWCYSCREDHTFFCESVGERVSDDIDNVQAVSSVNHSFVDDISVIAARVPDLVASGWLEVLQGGVLVRDLCTWGSWPTQFPQPPGGTTNEYTSERMAVTDHLRRLLALRGVEQVSDLVEVQHCICDDEWLPDEYRSDYEPDEPELPLDVPEHIANRRPEAEAFIASYEQLHGLYQAQQPTHPAE